MIRILLCVLCAISLASAQTLDMTKLKGMKPRSIGPAAMSGRITAIDAIVNNPDVIYVGAASGGVWKTTSGGTAWEPIFEKETTQSIGAIAIQQDNPAVVWVGTGEGNPRNSLNGGDGIYKSLDGGKSWKKVGLEKTRHIHRIIIDPKNPNTVYVAAIGSPWGDHPERGVYKTTDGGATWDRVLFANEKTGCADLVMDPSNPNKLIAAMWEHRRQPWTFKSGGGGSGLHLTYDGGKTWKKISSKEGMPEGELGRIGLAIAASKPEIVYAIVESKKNALYRSEDGGEKWTKVNDKPEIGDRPFYYHEIYVDTKNENRLYSIFSVVNVSEDGGRSFRGLLPYSGVHPDHHAWWIHPNDPSFMIDGNDGGVNITRDMGKTWVYSENIPVGQFYHINVDLDQPYNVYGGLQDNGSYVGPAYVWRSTGIRNSYWQEVFFGDGFDVAPDPENSRYGYAMSQGGNLGRFDLETGYTKFIKPTHPDVKTKLRFNWNAALAQDPFNKATIYYGSQFVHKSTNKGETWDVISGDLTTNNPDKQKQGDSGGLTLDATGAENHCTLLAIAPSAVQQGVIWVGTDDGNVQVTQDGGKTWTKVTIAGMPANAWVPQIQASAKNAGEAFVVVNNYRQFDYKPYLFRTRDFGKTWENLASAAQVGESNYTLCVAQDPAEPKLIFMGTENGLFVSVDEGKTWTRWTNDFPAGVPVMDLVIHPREFDLVIGTFGRAIWVLDDIRPLRDLAKAGTSLLTNTVKVFTAPDAYLASLQQPSGPRFDANAIYEGQNRPYGARITYVANKPEKKEEPAVEPKADQKGKGKPEVKSAAKPEEKKSDKPTAKYDSVKVEIFNSRNELINTIRQKAPEDNGVQRIIWALNEKGERGPSREKPREGGGGFGGFGPVVVPGTYKLRITFGDSKDSTLVSVKADPRIDATQQVLEARYAMSKQLQKLTKATTQATDRLRESKELVEDFEKRMKESKRTDLKEAQDKSKAMKDSINAIFDFALGKEDPRQGIKRDNDSRYSYIGRAASYINRSREPVNDTDRRVLAQAEQKIHEIIEKVNSFYATQWPEYRAMMEKVVLSPFKNYEPIKRD
jgi:photosystem II stability/assembly factor-like uncharacterized protein